jgi:hypothetical protein
MVGKLLIAIISANAFDKNLENAAKIPAEDFIVKPVNVQDLLNWLGKKLQIEWMNEPEKGLTLIEPESTTTLSDMIVPPKNAINILLKHINNGYVKGIHHQLNEIELSDEKYAEFVSKLRQHVNEFELDAMKQFIEELS